MDYYVSNIKPFERVEFDHNSNNSGGYAIEPMEMEDGRWAVPVHTLKFVKEYFVDENVLRKKPLSILEKLIASQIVTDIEKLQIESDVVLKEIPFQIKEIKDAKF